MYSVADKTSGRNERLLLSTRLRITEEEAERRVHTGEIASTKISEEEGYRVSEQQVCEYIADSSNTSLHT